MTERADEGDTGIGRAGLMQRQGISGARH